MTVTGIDGKSRTSDKAAERPMQVRYEQKTAKYGRIAEQNNSRFIPAIFPTLVEFTVSFKGLSKRNSSQVDMLRGVAKKSKVRSAMKWWSTCISTVITKTASRKVVFKASRMSESVLESQDEVIVPKLEGEETGMGDDKQAALDDIGSSLLPRLLRHVPE